MQSLVLGLDGATWSVLDPLIRLGAVPNLARLANTGVRGPLRSTLPPITGPAWTTFMTGKDPGQHGFIDWGLVDTDYILRLNTFADIRDHPFWHYLEGAGRRVGLFNIPFTYPPRPIDGFWVTGMSTPDLASAWAYPPELKEPLMAVLGPSYTFEFHVIHHSEADHADMVEALIELEGKRTQALESLIDEYTPDDVVVVYTGTDRVGHILGHRADFSGMKALEEASPLQRSILSYYRFLDEQVGRLLSHLDADGHVVVLSDHGFTTQEKVFLTNEWLRHEGYLVLDSLGHMAEMVRRRAARWLSGPQEARPERKVLDTRTVLGKTINLGRTRAFSNALNGIYLNVQGRFSKGCVRPGADYDDLRRELRDRLLELADPETGERIVEAVIFKEDVYSGPNVHLFPDLLLRFVGDRYAGDRYFFGPPGSCRRVGRSPFRYPSVWGHGDHYRDGILILSGPAFRASEALTSPAGLADVAPTLLHLMGLPVPSGMTGRVLVEAFTIEHCRANPVKQIDDPAVRQESDSLSREEEHMVYERLRDLGYLE